MRQIIQNQLLNVLEGQICPLLINLMYTGILLDVFGSGSFSKRMYKRTASKDKLDSHGSSSTRDVRPKIIIKKIHSPQTMRNMGSPLVCIMDTQLLGFLFFNKTMCCSRIYQHIGVFSIHLGFDNHDSLIL